MVKRTAIQAFVANNQGLPVQFTPDEVHFIIDTGRCCNAEYIFHSDKGELISVILQRVLYVPDCTIRLLCPRHLAESTGNPLDGFNSIKNIGILRCNGKIISVPHHQGTGLPIITIATGLENFANFCADMSNALPITNMSPVSHPITPVHFKRNLTSPQ